MATIYQIHNELGVSLRTLRRIDKAGYLKTTKSKNPDADRIETNLRKGNPLTAPQMLMLCRNRAWLEFFGPYADLADNMIDAMGDIDAEKMPWAISCKLASAADRDPDAIAACAEWLRQHIDANADDYATGQNYAYVAVRLMADIPENLWKLNFGIISRAISQIRAHKALAGYSFTNEKKRTVFQKPLDL